MPLSAIGKDKIGETELKMTDRRTMTVTEAGKTLGIGRAAAYEGARTGELPTIRIGKRILVPIPAFERLLGTDISKIDVCIKEGDATD